MTFAQSTARSGRVAGFLAALIGALLVIGLLSPPGAGAAPSERTLKVATYNIHHAQGADGVLDLERVAQVLEDSGAEVIALQEVDRFWSERSGYADQAEWLGRRLGMHMVYGKNLQADPAAPGLPDAQYGTAILSKYPIRDWSNTALPKFPAGEQRGLLQADIKVRGVSVRVLGTHLQHNNSDERLAQIDAILGITSADPRPTVLLGDMNAEPDSAEHAKLVTEYTDAWQAVGTGPGYTFDADDPKGRIDYVFTRGGATPRAATVPSTLASDHLPVVVDLVLPHPSGK